MKKIYYLKTCSTCARIIKSLNLGHDFTFQDLKENDITVSQLEYMCEIAGSYEQLFSKRAKLYKEMGLKDQQLTERDYKKFILEHYTFLKRPVVIINDQIFIGNSKKTVEATRAFLNEE